VTGRQRVIVALRNPREAAIVLEWLESDGYEAVLCPTAPAAIREMQQRPFDLLVADAAADGTAALRAQGLYRRPLSPTLLLGDAPPARGDVVTSPTLYLARPVDRVLLDCYVSMAMLEGGPVRRSTRKLVNPFEAIVNGMPSKIVDVSTEGVRIEMLPERRVALPPFFTIRVPLMGVGVAMQRVWTRNAYGASGARYCGAALAHNRASAVQGWRSLVETIPAALNAKLPRT
jgi:hypothetical protein